MVSQSPSSVLMVRPASFGFNPETRESNAFQAGSGMAENNEIQARALKEFDEFVKLLRKAGVQVVVMDDTPDLPRPDAVFPNNWISFHHDGTLVMYPMLAKNRRTERRPDVVYSLMTKAHFLVKNVLDLSFYENEGKFLEGTGSIVFDYPGKTAYAVLSPRTNLSLLTLLCNELGYQAIPFNASDLQGRDIYHTNVVMAIGSGYAVVCLDSVIDPKQRNLIIGSLNKSHLEIVPISIDQMYSFAGNMIELCGNEKRTILAMSERAYKSLRLDQLGILKKFAKPVFCDLKTIETISGGSARCMMAGIFLPKMNLM